MVKQVRNFKEMHAAGEQRKKENAQTDIDPSVAM
jgi:hypothetical protein